MLAVDPSLGSWIERTDLGRVANKKYPPGSVIKPFTILAAYESGARSDMVIRCGPSDPNSPVRKECWYRPGHGTVDMEKAIALSCDRYFLALAPSIKFSRFLDVLKRFGLIDAADGTALKALSDEERIRVMAGLSVRLKISPTSLLSAYCALFNGGYLFEDRGAGKMALTRRIPLERNALKILVAGTSGATRYGTASDIGKAFPDKEILSKTGTGIYSEGTAADHSRTHAWYVGISPARNPRRAILIFILSGTGARDAVPAAARFWPEVFRHAPL